MFLTGELPRLEDYEIDLILSPVFTPKLTDQAVFAEILGDAAIPREQWPVLIQQLIARPTRAQLISSDGRTHAVALREVTLERYVHRLRLDATIPESLMELINKATASDGPLLKAVARRAVWENDARRNILVRYLAAAAGARLYRPEDAVEVLNLVESYKPADAGALRALIPAWQQTLQHEINTASEPKPFFSQRVEQMHGGDRDHRHHDQTRQDAKQNELEFLDRLQQILSG